MPLPGVKLYGGAADDSNIGFKNVNIGAGGERTKKDVKAPKESAERLEAMSEKEFDKWLLTNMDSCQCRDCTTYNECAEKSGERLYCVATRSPICIVKKGGCLCPECIVYQRLGFSRSYHCLEGPEINRD